MKRSMKRLGIFGCGALLAIGLGAQALEYSEKLSEVATPILREVPVQSLKALRRTALQNPNEENVKTYLQANREEIEREKKFESVKETVLSKNPDLKTFYEHHDLELRLENARQRFIEAQYQSAFQESLSCQKPTASLSEDTTLK